MLKNTESFVGRGFSRDISTVKSLGLQPLKLAEASIFSTLLTPEA